MRILYFGTYRSNYARNRLMVERLRLIGAEVIECHERLWNGLEDREQAASGGWMNPAFLLRVISTYTRLLWRYLHVGDYDVMVVGYPGQGDIPLARLLSWIRRKPLVWDILMSIYLIAAERHLEKRSSLTVRLIQLLEKFAVRLPDRLIIDTDEYARWYQETYSVSPNRIRLVPLGADDRVFQPAESARREDSIFRCLYYGSFIPNHGVRYILEAARVLQQEPSIQFELIGTGPDHANMVALAKDYGLTNVAFIEWMDEPSLVKKVACADVCLGTFGRTPQALMTMQNKIHEGMAMAKPVINGDSPVMRSILKHGENIYLCERESGASLADAISTLRADPGLRARLASLGYAYYREHLSFLDIGRQFHACLEELV